MCLRPRLAHPGHTVSLGEWMKALTPAPPVKLYRVLWSRSTCSLSSVIQPCWHSAPLGPDVLAPTSHLSTITGDVVSLPLKMSHTVCTIFPVSAMGPARNRCSISVVLTACVPDGGVSFPRYKTKRQSYSLQRAPTCGILGKALRGQYQVCSQLGFASKENAKYGLVPGGRALTPGAGFKPTVLSGVLPHSRIK